MKCGLQMALAVGAGYLLGRSHKLRLALALAAAGATGRLGVSGGDLLQQGLKTLGSSPELSKLTDSVRGELLEVGKAAVRTAASKQIDSLTSRLHERAEFLRGQGEAAEEEPEEEREPARGRRAAGRRPAGRSRAAREEPEDEEEEYEEGPEEEEEEEEEEPAPARGRRSTGRSRSEREEPEEEEEEEEEEPEGEPPARRRAGARRTQTATRERPVRRARG
ncbi:MULTISPECIES: hypothetical protein [Streptosporangium]|uniref:Mg-chelatase subunit ChlI n=1 Tax=Streptosporangium brasiliense TaxID=47480 RepID=A0ABT9RB95_9ACTN|nr:hypothetical protein [Streptosporangium brasiliense]MDP9866518.1 Mg-chelatase subunit ChlI [Streptosporangium brasiliense]